MLLKPMLYVFLSLEKSSPSIRGYFANVRHGTTLLLSLKNTHQMSFQQKDRCHELPFALLNVGERFLKPVISNLLRWKEGRLRPSAVLLCVYELLARTHMSRWPSQIVLVSMVMSRQHTICFPNVWQCCEKRKKKPRQSVRWSPLFILDQG